MGAHDDLVAVSIDMALAQRNRLSKHIVASTEKIDEEDFVVPDEAENSLIVVASALRAESNDDPLASVCLHHTLSHRNGEQIALVSEELERRGQIAVVNDVEQTVSCLLSLHLAKLHGLGRELNIVTIGLTTAAKFNFVAAESTDFKKAVAFDASQLRRVSDSYFRNLARLELTRRVVDLYGIVLAVVIDALY